MFPDATWTHLRLFALDPVDLALSKLERNSDRDREDVVGLALRRHGTVDRRGPAKLKAPAVPVAHRRRATAHR
jgi:hypothetical protein